MPEQCLMNTGEQPYGSRKSLWNLTKTILIFIDYQQVKLNSVDKPVKKVPRGLAEHHEDQPN
jgi:hypothetical protein